MIRVLTFSTLFPNSVSPSHGIFVETRLQHLVRSGHVSAKVIAPVPWFPSSSKIFGKYAGYSAISRHEVISGVDVFHPRYLAVPKIGMNIAPILLAMSGYKQASLLLKSGWEFDVIDAHYFYPDGVAAALIGKLIDKPVVITARGSDLNRIGDFLVPRMWMRMAARSASALITVSESLRARAIGIGLAPDRMLVMRNGVDLQLFCPRGARSEVRAKWGFERQVVLSVGNLVKLKGHEIVIRAIQALPSVELVIVGTGPEETRLKAIAHENGVGSRVRFLGRLPQEELSSLYFAADVLVLASSHEGWPNVLLESLACGTRVVASSVGGIPEIVQDNLAGILVKSRTPSSFAEAIRKILVTARAEGEVRKYAGRFDWGPTTRGQLNLFQSLVK